MNSMEEVKNGIIENLERIIKQKNIHNLIILYHLSKKLN